MATLRAVVLTSGDGSGEVLMLVEYDIDDYVDRRPWWPAQTVELLRAAPGRRAA